MNDQCQGMDTLEACGTEWTEQVAEDTSTKSDTGEIKSVGHITSLFGCYFKSPNDVLPAAQRNVSMAAVPGRAYVHRQVVVVVVFPFS